MSEVEARSFTYCQAFFSEPFACRTFIVMTPSRPEARSRAAAYADSHYERAPYKINLYPRTYVKNARTLYAAGKHD